MFERTYKIDGSREHDKPREKNQSIEMSDREHMEWITIRNQPPPIPMKLDMPILKKQIDEKGMNPNEKGTCKASKKKPKRVSTKSNKTAVEKV